MICPETNLHYLNLFQDKFPSTVNRQQTLSTFFFAVSIELIADD